MASHTSPIDNSVLLQKASQSLPPAVYELLFHYCNLHIGQTLTPCPYWINKHSLKGFLGGKGTPDEIENEVIRLASPFLIAKHLNADHIQFYLKENRIGVDCSGFAYQMLNAFDIAKGGHGLEAQIQPAPGGNPLNAKRFRTNADYLTNHHNARPVSSLQDIQPGDMIRMTGGKHITIIVSASPEEIIYAHSSHLTQVTGVHLNYISITNSNTGLEDQLWHEQLKDGQPYSQKYNPTNGDGIFRLKWWIS